MMSNYKANQFLALPMSLLLGGCLALIPNGILLAQRTVMEALPPPPNVPLQPTENNQYEQDFQPLQPTENNQYEQNFQPEQSAQISQYNQNFERYLVYVDSSDYQTLQQVRLIEPGAYVRPYQGRSVIQSGIFSRQSNALQRVRQLQSYGINNARIVSFANGEEIPAFGNRNDRNESRYYVAIPTKSEELTLITQQVRRAVGRDSLVRSRTQPRGPHVAVGPFANRTDAEEWNQYLQHSGFGNARVYYGR